MAKRVPVIAGNWKMYKTRDEALAFLFAVNEKVPSRSKVETVICAPAILLSALVKRQGDNVRFGAQNMHFAEEGAYTGEISAAMLEKTGVEYVVIGHSERREYFGETDSTVNKKIVTSLKHAIVPIVCVGESLKIREKGTTNRFIKKQIISAYNDISASDAEKTIVAYEPIWAIGTGRTATPEMANDTIKAIRRMLLSLYGRAVANHIRILYGGSVKPDNIGDLLLQSDIDGALIGGASLDPNSYLEMVNKAI